MSELLTMQDLANGHLDVKALGEAANGDENTIVTTRTGNTYPSAERAINIMFQNGGLPAVPFATKALMTASSLANDKYAMVTDDTINNGLYVKTAGAWVKSAYDPVAQSNEYIDKKAFRLGYPVEVFDTVGWTNSVISREGVEIASTLYTTSQFIKVSKGDCFIVTNKLPDVQDYNTVSFYDNDKVYVGSIAQGKSNLATNLTESSKLEVKVGVYSSVDSFSNIGTIVPSDGYIKVSYMPNGGKTVLVKTNYEGLVSNTPIQLPKESMKAFDGKFYSVVREKSAAINGVNTASAVIGNPINYTVAGVFISVKYPITEGDYISVMGASASLASSTLFAEDAQGNFLGELDEYTNTSLTGTRGGFAYINRKSNVTGFLRIQHHNFSNVPCLVSITKAPVSVENQYLKTGQKIDFLTTGVSRSVNVTTSTALHDAKWSEYAAENNTDTGVLSRSLPYLLKKGEVLEYGIKATIDPVMFIALPNKFTAVKALATSNYFTPISATEILDLKTKGRALLTKIDSSDIFIGDAVKGKAAYCNEYEDTIIVFLRPREGTTAYTTYKCNNQYEITIYSKEDYIAKRNSELESRLKTLSKYTTARASTRLSPKYTSSLDLPYNQHASFPPILVFKGEILNCLTGSITRVKALRLRNPNIPSETNALPINLGSVYLTSDESGIFNLPIREDDENSYNHTQVYARETCVVHVSFSALGKDNTTLLDVDGMIENSFFKPRIVHIDDAVVGENIMPTLIRAKSAVIIPSPSDSNKRELSFLTSAITDIYATFANKDTYFEYSRVVIGNNDRAVWSPLDNDGELVSTGKPSVTLFDYLHTEEGDAKGNINAYPATVGMTNVRIANQVPSNGLIYVNSNTRARSANAYGSIENYDAGEANYVEQEILEGEAGFVTSRKLAVNESFSFFVQNISEEVFNRNYVVTDDRHVHFPDTRGIYFNFCEPTSEDFDVEYYSTLQVKRNDEVLMVLTAKTKNQGQSSATSARKSINLKCYNSKGKRMTLKFDDNVPQETFTIKSYLSSDAGMFKDNLSADLWYEIRNADPYPIGGPLPPEVVADTNYPANALARGTTFGFPTEVHRGGGFFSLASLRNKKDEDNYGIQVDNPNHIMLQHEPTPRGFMVFGALDLVDFEVRSPEMEGYEVSSLTLPPEYIGVQDNINRLLDWINGVYNGDIDLKTTYKDYIDLDSFLDYIISINVMSHWDSQRNNFILATHDAKIWRVYLYDADQSWGSTSIPVSPYQITLTQPTIFKFIFENMTDEVKRRYAKLRDKGIVNVRKQQADMQKYGSRIDPKSIELEAKIWRPIPAHSLVPYTMAWTNSRTRFLDIYYGYVDKSRGVVAQSLLSIPSIAAGATAIVNYLNTAAEIGDVLSLETGANLTGIKAVITVETGGKIVLSLQNTTNATINGVSGYANIIKEIKYA